MNQYTPIKYIKQLKANILMEILCYNTYGHILMQFIVEHESL